MKPKNFSRQGFSTSGKSCSPSAFSSSTLIVRMDSAIALRRAFVISSMFTVSNGIMLGFVRLVLLPIWKVWMKQAVEKDRHDGNGDDEEHNSETHAHRKDPRRLTLVQIEYVGCEIYFLVGETYEESALNINIGLVGARSLAH